MTTVILPSDKITEENRESLFAWTNKLLGERFPEGPSMSLDGAMLYRPNPIRLMFSDVPTWGDFAAAFRVCVSHLEYVMRESAKQQSHEIIRIEIHCRHLMDNESNLYAPGMELIAQVVVKSKP